MKKTLAMLLAVLMLLCLIPASGFADTSEEPDEAAAIELNRKIYEANRLDALLGKYESLAYSFYCPEQPERSVIFWETEESVYKEWTNSAEFYRDRIIYGAYSEAETDIVDVVCGVAADPDFAPHYSIAPGTMEEFFDPVGEHVTRIWTEGGVIHETSQYDEAASKKYVENELGLEYAGQTIKSEICVDAETYEFLSLVDTMVQDGEETVVCLADAMYDEPEPMACRSLRGNFERYTENMMTVTFVVDPGTDHAFERQIKVPANTESGMVYSTVPVAFFNDPDGETMYHWDRMSDYALYVFTNPDEELLERFETLYEQVAAEPDEPDTETFLAFFAANDVKEVLSRHTNATAASSTFRDGEEILTEWSYKDADTHFWKSSDGIAALHYVNLWLDGVQTEEGGVEYAETIFDTVEAGEAAFQYVLNDAYIVLPEQEKLVKTVDMGDGRFFAVTEIDDPEYLAALIESVGPEDGYAYAEGMTARYEYTFDSQNGDVLSIDSFLIDSEGEEHFWQRYSFAYDVEPYDPSAEGEPFAEYISATADPARSRLITVTFEPGTENERTIGCRTSQMAYFLVFKDGEYVEEFYTDPACTQAFGHSDGVSDLALYVK